MGSSRAHAAAMAMPPGTKGHQCHQPHPTLGKGRGNFSFPVTYPSHSDAVFHRDSAQVAQRLGSSDNVEGIFFFFLIYPSFRSFYHNHWRNRCVCHSPLRGICPQGDGTATSVPISTAPFLGSCRAPLSPGTQHSGAVATPAPDVPVRSSAPPAPGECHRWGRCHRAPAAAVRSLICAPSGAVQVGNGAGLHWQIPCKCLSESVALILSGAFHK